MKFERDDGTGRPARKAQDEILTWIEKAMEEVDVIAVQASTGIGKSWIARVIQKATKAHVVVPSNILMDDTYTKAYPTVNFLKGKTHYECKEQPGFTCHENTAELKNKACADCTYGACKSKALSGQPTFVNPMSLFYLQKDGRYRAPDVLIIDEADKLRDMLLLIAGKQFRRSKYNFPDTTSEIEIIDWMAKQYRTLAKLYSTLSDAEERDNDLIADVAKEVETIDCTLKGIRENPQNYCIYVSDGTHRGKPEKFLNVVPLEPPKYLVSQILACKKLILLSATLPRTRIKALIQDKPFKYLDVPSPIEKWRRTVSYRPTPFPMNFKTDPAAIVKHVESIIREVPDVNVMIHASYGLAAKMAPHFTLPVLTHTSETKTQALATFKSNGGILLASGMAEGIDLKGSLCELNIVPMLTKMSPYDPAVKKRLAWADGQYWYDLETLSLVIQQLGRSVRGEDDKSRLVVCDPMFPKLVGARGPDLPQSFVQSINWTGKFKPWP